MKRLTGLVACSLVAILAAPPAATAQTNPGGPARAGSSAQARIPDLDGTWTNATITRFERPEEYGNRLRHTPEEVAKLEGAVAASEEAGRRPTDPNATTEDLYKSAADCHPVRGTACNYNDAWVEPGSHVLRVNGEPRTSIITFPENGRIPYRPDVRRTRGFSGGADNPEDRSLPERCLVSQNIRVGALLSPTLYNNTYEIVQSPDAVAIIVEMSHDARIVRLNAKHGTTPKWFGDSIGWYEGDTLVVETTNFHPTQLAGNSEKLKITERFTRLGPNQMLYRFRVEDPETYTQPWGGEYVFTPSPGPLYEYACHEGNYGLVNILAGARQAEEQAGQAGAPAESGK